MATKYGTNATLVLNQTIPQLVEAPDSRGVVHTIYDEYTLTAAFTTADVIKMGTKIPQGARVTEVILDTPDLDSGSNANLTVGWLASDDAVEAASAAGFINAHDAHTAAKTQSMSSIVQGSVAGKFKKFSAAVQPTITIATAGDVTSGTIRLMIQYTFL